MDATNWRDEAACAVVGGELWFPEQGGAVRPAKAICSTCPAARFCLEYALDNRLLESGDGIWAGTTPQGRRRILKERAA